MGNIDWKDKKNIYAISIIVLILAAAYCVYTYMWDPFVQERTSLESQLQQAQAELDKINELIEEDPEYFYHIIPYAYVFGLTNRWINKFEDIDIVQPEWIKTSASDSSDSFDAYMMGRMMSDCSASVSHNIQLHQPSGPVTGLGDSPGSSSSGSSSHDSWSGGGFSGGGYSGGGGGGGGGGAW